MIENNVDLSSFQHNSKLKSGSLAQVTLNPQMRENPIEQSLDSWQNQRVSKNPMHMLGHASSKVETKQDSESNQRDGLKSAQTLRQQAAVRSWYNRLQEFIDFKDRNGHGKFCESLIDF